MSPSPLDEFGSTSLEDFFEDTLGDIPADSGKDWSGEKVKVEHTYTKTHLVAMLTDYTCKTCHSHTFVAQGYAVRKVHHTRNQMVEFLAIHSSEIVLYDNLPGMRKYITHEVPFCAACIPSNRFPEGES